MTQEIMKYYVNNIQDYLYTYFHEFVLQYLYRDKMQEK